MGTHEELMKLEGLYHSLVTRSGIHILISAALHYLEAQIRLAFFGGYGTVFKEAI